MAPLLLAAFSFGSCAKANVREIVFTCPSPNGRYLVTFYQESGGGAAGWVNQFVSIRASESDKPQIVLHLNRANEVMVTWLGPTRFRIGYPDTALVVRWQNWFEPDARGRIHLVELPSQDGKFTRDKPGCVK